MARVTVEDCIERVHNRFELVMVAAQRARKIGSGASLTLDRDNDKNPVVALREIAVGTVAVDNLREELVRNHQRILEAEDESEDIIDIMEGEAEWGDMATRGGALDFTEDDEEEDEGGEPSLEDLAGGAMDEGR